MRRFLPFILLLAAPVLAEDLPMELKPAGEGVVAEVISGDTLRLADGREVRLAGVEAPWPGLGDAPAGPLADEARAALAELAAGRAVALFSAGQELDRHGRTLAHLRRDDGVWLQAGLLRRGWARVRVWPETRAGAGLLLAAEGEAKVAGRGLWAHPSYAVRDAAALAEGDVGAVQVVRGTVRRALRLDDRIVLGFGPDWRTDFTAELAPGDLRAFRKAGLDPLALKGRVVEVRGWVESRDGPCIRLTLPEQLTVLPE
ncbi:thermonuclease family protein [Aerophototrophica crusticola]|uniref:Thermonuclease family protein n=1 Tax=Aerophototrophica crusticola TaxID=1709002 RepID=A0A858R9K4_9PROT|nr:thermonuclease family protein [Rhodospirillaceae bacterium B3]